MVETFLYFILVLCLVDIVMLTGIVLRVEKRLDVSFKFILIAMIVFTGSVVADLLITMDLIAAGYWDIQLKAIFILLFTIGVWEVRQLTRHLDGELPSRKR